jgi:hypothetical protein
MTVALLFIASITILYSVIGWGRVGACMSKWLDKPYWTDYNIIEFLAWFAKALIIIPALIFHQEVWQLHFGTLVTSSLLIWASMRKGLPTLLAFNSMWILLSLIVIMRNM